MQRLRARRKNIYLIAAILFTLVLVVTPACTRVHTTTAITTPLTTTTSQTTISTTPITATNSITMPTTTTPTPTPTTATMTYSETTPTPIEGEATEYLGHQLTPLSAQLNNAIKGTQNIDQATYKLTIDGLVDHPLTLSYADLLAYPQISQLVDLDCVEGWSFTAKWTGPTLNSIFADAGIQSGAKIAIFYTADDPQGFTSLDLSYLTDNNIILGMKDNDITLTPDRGFPFQVVAYNKFGYKWAKWVTRIEISDNTDFRGFWEGNGYNNNGDINGPSS